MTLNNSINAALPVAVAKGGTGATSLTDGGLLIGQGTGAITATSALDDGELIIGSTGLDPVVATLTAGTGIAITNGAGSITIAATGANPWTEVTGTTQAMTANVSYGANNASLVTFTLPETASFGDKIIVTGIGAGGWRINQNADQVIHFGEVSSTAGVGGYILSTHRRDTVELVCVVANTEFNIVDAVGNIDLL